MSKFLYEKILVMVWLQHTYLLLTVKLTSHRQSLVSILGLPIRKIPSSEVWSHEADSPDRCVGVMQNGKVEILVNDQGNRITPSYVAFTDEERLVGDAAKNQYAANPQRTIYDVK